MSGEDIDLAELLGPPPETENLVDEAPKRKRAPRGPRLTVNRNDGPSKALLERSRSYNIRASGETPNRGKPRKNSPERLTRLLNAASENGVANSACLRAGIGATTLKYWLQKSLEGVPGDGFDLILNENDENDESPISIRFHKAWSDALQKGAGRLETSVMKRAMGFREVLTHQGRVIYKQDPGLVALGFTGMDAYLLDEFGAPVPETVEKMDPDLAMYMLEHLMPEKYGKKSSVDVSVRGGVLVVGMRAATSEALNEIEEKYRKEGLPAVTFEEDDDDGVA
jgi:hypothetical protein